MQRIIKRLSNFYKRKIIRDPFFLSVAQWVAIDGDNTLAIDYPLTEESVVFDVGGYKGEWSQKIFELYNCNIHIFEPVLQYYMEIVSKFESISKIKVHNFGLLDKSMGTRMALLDTKSSIYLSGEEYVDIDLRDISSFVQDWSIEKIDLIKISIEGGEYSLLRRMIDEHIVEKCLDILIQFHTFVPNANVLREEIREALGITHLSTFCYPLVWENWRKRQ